MDGPVPEPVLDERRVRSGPIDLPAASTSATAPLKRTASEAFEDASDDETTYKKLKDTNDHAAGEGEESSGASVDGGALADNLEEELQCGCCSAIVYRPVVVQPCQHFFCGRCVRTYCVVRRLGRMG